MSDLISRADAIEAVCGVVIDEFDISPTKGYEVAEKALSALPSADRELANLKEGFESADAEQKSDAYKRGFDDCKRAYEIELTRSADAVHKPDYSYEADMVRRLKEALSAEAGHGWVPCSERLPSAEDCPMDCMVTRQSQYVGNYTDMAVAEKNGTWTHEDWKAISYGDVESGRKTGLISTRDDEIIAWIPLPKPYREESEA